MRTIHTFVIVTILLTCVRTVAADSVPALEPLRTKTPPVLDGRLDDAVWKDAPSVSGFKTYMPDFGSNMLGDTRIYFAYDDENMYFAVRCYDSEPDNIKSSVAARDKIESDDWICLHLDSYNDRQSMYSFYANPAGIQMDSRAAANDEEDFSVDLVWYSRGRIDKEGYVVEVQIPFKCVRYATAEPVTMGILCERSIIRASQRGSYPALDPQEGVAILTQTGTIYYRDIVHRNPIEILPAFTYNQKSSLRQGRMESEDRQMDFSLNAKLGMTPNLVVEGTYNPDFSQVEADAQQVDFNIRYALYYEEKRPFFFEGKEHFNYGGAMMGDYLQEIINTRTIINPVAGVKLTGKAGEKNMVASLYALDELPAELQEGTYAHVGVLRYKRALNRDSFIGACFTARELESEYNRVAGFDGQIRLSGSSYIGFHGFSSQSRMQDEPNREDGYWLGVTTTYDTRDWHVNTWARDNSEDFRTDVGHLTRTGISRIGAVFTRYLYPASKLFLRLDPMLVSYYTYDKESRLWEHHDAFYFGLTLPRNTQLRFGPAYYSEVFLGREFDRSFIRFFMSSQYTKQLSVSFNYVYGRLIRYVADPYEGAGTTAAASLGFQPTTKFNSSLDLQYTDFCRQSDGMKEFDYLIVRSRNTYQMNRYLFFKAIAEYNSFRKEFLTDMLVSFTYIPGTVIHFGYGSLYAKTRWVEDNYVPSDRYLETGRGLFFKASYNWIL